MKVKARAAIYTRLSKEDFDKGENVSESIRNQESMLTSYAAEKARGHISGLLNLNQPYVWLVDNYEKEPERAEELMDFIGAASTIECQVYPVNAKYHMQLEGVPITTKSRKQDDALLTSSKRLEIEQYRRVVNRFRDYFFGK